MFFKGLISSDISIDAEGRETSPGINLFQPVSDMASSPSNPALSADEVSSAMSYGSQNFSIPLSGSTIYADSLCKRAIDVFPGIITLRPGQAE